MIFNLQILRALASVGVVIYHIDYHFVPGVHTEFLGVATFFVISGFIMCFITHDRADGFLINRVVRIVPLYWLATLAPAIDHFRQISLADILGSLVFWPSANPPVLHVGWTLNFEVYFYAIFAVAILASRRFAPLIAGAVIIAVFEINRIAPGIFLAHYYSHMYIMFFLDGIALFYAFRIVQGRVPRFLAFPASALLIFCYLIQIDMPDPGLWTYSLPPTIVGAALLMAAAGVDLNWRPLTLLGNASYALYLTHTSAMGFLRLAAPTFLAAAKVNVVPFVLLLALCIGLGIAVHLYIEKPLLRTIRMMLATNAKKPSGQRRVPEFRAADTKQ